MNYSFIIHTDDNLGGFIRTTNRNDSVRSQETMSFPMKFCSLLCITANPLNTAAMHFTGNFESVKFHISSSWPAQCTSVKL